MREIHVSAGYIPSILQDTEISSDVLTFTSEDVSVHVTVPAPTAEELRNLSLVVKEAQEQVLSLLHTNRLIEIIDEAMLRLLDRGHPVRKELEQLLPVISGDSTETVRHALHETFKMFRKQELTRFLASAFRDSSVLDAFTPNMSGGFEKAIGPRLTTHVWAGNVPGLPLWSFLSNLLVKGGAIGKMASAEPLFIGAFVMCWQTWSPSCRMRLRRCGGLVEMSIVSRCCLKNRTW